MSNTEIIVSSVYDFDDVRIDLSHPEDVLVFVDDDRSVTIAAVFSENREIMGAASYDDTYGAGLDYTVKELIDAVDRVGWMVVVGVTATFIKGDMYTTDDDMRFQCRTIRDATDDEKRPYLE